MDKKIKLIKFKEQKRKEKEKEIRYLTALKYFRTGNYVSALNLAREGVKDKDERMLELLHRIIWAYNNRYVLNVTKEETWLVEYLHEFFDNDLEKVSEKKLSNALNLLKHQGLNKVALYILLKKKDITLKVAKLICHNINYNRELLGIKLGLKLINHSYFKGKLLHLLKNNFKRLFHLTDEESIDIRMLDIKYPEIFTKSVILNEFFFGDKFDLTQNFIYSLYKSFNFTEEEFEEVNKNYIKNLKILERKKKPRNK